MTRARRDGADDARDLLAETDFFGAPRSRDGGARARARSGDTGELRQIAEPAESGRGRHRDPEPRRRAVPSVATSAISGAAAARTNGTSSASPATGRTPVSATAPSFDTGGWSGRPESGPSSPFTRAGTAETQLVAGQPAAGTEGRFAGLRRLLRRRWFAPSLTGGAVLCSVAFVTGVAQFAGTACAAVPPAGVTTSGEATFYDGGTGNCSYPTLPADDLYVALGPDDYSDSAACGGYLDVTGPTGSVRVKIVDQCPECTAGHIDLSREAFARIADPQAGVVPVTYSAVSNPSVPADLSVRVKEGSSEFWLALLIDNHGNPLTKVEVSGAGSTAFTALSRTSFNYWVAEGGVGGGPFSVRVTDNAGRTATIPNVTLTPGAVQQSTVALGDGVLTAPPTKTATPGPQKSQQTTQAPTNGASAESANDADSSADAPLAAAGDSNSDQTDDTTESAVTPDASASEEIAANPVPSSSLAVPRAEETTAEYTGRNSCG
ncbi:expansin EXLX1 family cellulose-binding protein [Cryptosporangium minutisporangium]|uniref:Expansin-like EG45 domain-containing protein n=1 Tax=Cryptosporangium minutisporangium TaxID=113569 RepID=A0ABP6SW77_9ACTN